MNKKRILIVEDEEPIADMLSYALMKEGYLTDWADSGEKGIEMFSEASYDLVLLDLMLPGIGGFEVCKTLSVEYPVPIVILTAKNDSIDKILGMELGADDYITKPFDIREVMVRIKAIFRRIELDTSTMNTVTKDDGQVIPIGRDIRIFKDKREVTKNGERVELSSTQYELLLFLAQSKGRIFSRNELLDRVWGYDVAVDTRTVDIHIQRIRKKLQLSKDSTLIETVFGFGYRIQE